MVKAVNAWVRSAFGNVYLYDNDCLCSPWNIASATWEQEIPLTVEQTLHHPSLRKKSSFKTMLLFADLDFHVMSKDKFSEDNLVHEIGF